MNCAPSGDREENFGADSRATIIQNSVARRAAPVRANRCEATGEKARAAVVLLRRGAVPMGRDLIGVDPSATAAPIVVQRVGATIGVDRTARTTRAVDLTAPLATGKVLTVPVMVAAALMAVPVATEDSTVPLMVIIPTVVPAIAAVLTALRRIVRVLRMDRRSAPVSMTNGKRESQ